MSGRIVLTSRAWEGNSSAQCSALAGLPGGFHARRPRFEQQREKKDREATMGTMFETPKPKEKASQTGMWIGIIVVVVVVAIGIFLFTSGARATPRRQRRQPQRLPRRVGRPIRRRSADNQHEDGEGSLRNHGGVADRSAEPLEYLQLQPHCVRNHVHRSGRHDAGGEPRRAEGRDRSRARNKTNSSATRFFPTGTAGYRIKITGATSTVPQQ